jgi:CRISPR-associated protein Cas5t
VGDLIPLDSTLFGYHFVFNTKFVDYEHLWFKDGNTRKMIPYRRELLFNPVLTLYLTDLSLEDAFRSPRYPVVLGRSQDLMSYSEICVVTLQRAQSAYFEHTLLPLRMAPRLREPTIAVTMPRYIDPRRRTTWGQYALLQRRAFWPQQVIRDEWDEEDDVLIFDHELVDEPVTLWVDTDTPADARRSDTHRAVWLHSFTD